MEGGLSPKEVRFQQQFNADTAALLDAQQSMEEEGEEESSEAEAQQEEEQRIQEEYQEAVANAQSEEEIENAHTQAQQALQASLRAFGGDVGKTIKDQGSRMLGKYGGNLANAGGSFGFDAWVTYTITYLYIMMRGAISILVPETSANESADEGMAKTVGKAGLHVIFPPYRPLQEPGDFAYFLGACALTIFIVGTLLTVGGIFAFFIMYLSKVFPGI